MKLNKSLLAAAVAMTMASSVAMAGQLLLDPTGTGSNSGLAAIIGPGSSDGNMLGDNVLIGAGAGTLGGTIYAHNGFDLTGFGIPGGELTYQFVMPVTSSVVGLATSVGAQLSFLQAGVAFFDLYFQQPGDASDATGAGYAANPVSGDHACAAGTSCFLARGTVTLGSSFAFTNTSGLVTAPMAANNAMASIAGTGSTVLVVNFNPLLTNHNYVRNNIDSLLIDLTTSNALSLQYNQFPLPVVNASSTFNVAAFAGGAVAPAFGNAINDFVCGGPLAPACDFEMQMNTTLLFNSTPEPSELGLLGAAFSIMGAFAARRRRSAMRS